MRKSRRRSLRTRSARMRSTVDFLGVQLDCLWRWWVSSFWRTQSRIRDRTLPGTERRLNHCNFYTPGCHPFSSRSERQRPVSSRSGWSPCSKWSTTECATTGGRWLIVKNVKMISTKLSEKNLSNSTSADSLDIWGNMKSKERKFGPYAMKSSCECSSPHSLGFWACRTILYKIYTI